MWVYYYIRDWYVLISEPFKA